MKKLEKLEGNESLNANFKEEKAFTVAEGESNSFRGNSRAAKKTS